jgi:hypothetical protein
MQAPQSIPQHPGIVGGQLLNEWMSLLAKHIREGIHFLLEYGPHLPVGLVMDVAHAAGHAFSPADGWIREPSDVESVRRLCVSSHAALQLAGFEIAAALTASQPIRYSVIGPAIPALLSAVSSAFRREFLDDHILKAIVSFLENVFKLLDDSTVPVFRNTLSCLGRWWVPAGGRVPPWPSPDFLFIQTVAGSA